MNIKIFLIVVLSLLTFNIAKAQKGRFFAKNMIVGSSLTYWQVSKSMGNTYNELTWNINVSVSLNKKIFLGLQYLNIHTNGKHISLEKYNLYGIFAQYNLLNQTKHRLFAETSINKGNYCTAGNDYPYKQEDLYYWGIGVGHDFPLKRVAKGLYADFSFINYFLITPVVNKHSYTQYIMGLNYRFGK